MHIFMVLSTKEYVLNAFSIFARFNVADAKRVPETICPAP